MFYKHLQQQNIMTTKMKFSMEQVQGFLDADGSIEAKVRVGSQKPISFHVNVIFSQKDKDVLQTVIDSIGATNTKGSPDKTVSQRPITNPSGTQSTGRSISIAFSSNGGQALLNAWAKNPPKAPTKYLDYSIARILAEVSATQTSTALGVVTKHLKPGSTVAPQDELTAGLALLWLRYRMFGRVKAKPNQKSNPIEYYYQATGATPAQIGQSVDVGVELFEPIKQACQKHTADLLNPNSKSVNISDDYLLGYHMGDGSFQLSTDFGRNNATFKAKFHWTLTDCTENKPLLEAVKNYLTTKGVKTASVGSQSTFYRLTISNIRDCSVLVGLWSGKPLPSTRLNQYDSFVKAVNLYNLKSLKANLDQAEAFINLKWSMNPGTNSKKTGSLTEDLTKIREWYNTN